MTFTPSGTIRLKHIAGQQVNKWRSYFCAAPKSQYTQIIVLTAYPDVSTAAEMVRLAGWDYISKVPSWPDKLRISVQQALLRQRLIIRLNTNVATMELALRLLQMHMNASSSPGSNATFQDGITTLQAAISETRDDMNKFFG